MFAAKTIQSQKLVADKLMADLKQQFGNATVAGGAPRDWYFGDTARDIDVYVKLEDTGVMFKSKSEYQADAIRGVTNLYLLKPKLLGKLDENYGDISDLKTFISVFEMTYEGNLINIIFLKGKEQEVYDHFDMSICKIKYEDGVILESGDFADTIQSGIITVSCLAPKHLLKMLPRFKKFSFKYIGV